MNFTDRCAIAAGCLPRADYRAKLEALHAEMLAEIALAGAEERERAAALADAAAYKQRFISGEADSTTRKLRELAETIRSGKDADLADLAGLKERGAAAWLGVDPQALREWKA